MSEPAVDDYTIGWICALQEEYEAGCRMLDDEFDGPETAEINDNNTYIFGRVGAHKVVVACLPHGRYGTGPASMVARDMVRSFPNLRFALMVGIGGGAPTQERDIRLGDVVVGVPQGDHGGVVQYDMGKRLFDGRFRFQRTGQLNAPPEVILGALPEMQRRHNDPRKPDRVAEHLRRVDDMPSYARPADDRLYRPDSAHKGGKTCKGCEAGGLVKRAPRKLDREVIVHYGTIASANTVMKSAVDRDQYANDPTLDVLCFEMEVGGLMNNFPCLYAALAAAAYARELLHVVKPTKVALLPAWLTKMERHVAGIQGNVSDIARKADYIVRRQRGQDDEKLLEWLTPIDYGPQQSDYLKRQQPCTGQWFLASNEFQTWLKTGGRTLFCPGIPGAGKTILTSVVVDHVSTKFQKGSNVGIALLKQLFQEQPSIPKVMQMLYNRHKDRSTLPSCSELSDTLLAVVTSYKRIFIIVDALDECTTAGGCRAKLLSAIFNLREKAGANVFVTSRISKEISKSFDSALCVKIHATANDLKLYLEGQMQVQQSDVFSSNIRSMAVSRIINAADGMFLLAELHMNTIIGLPTQGDMKHALDRLSTGADGLDEKYRLAMERIEDQSKPRRDLTKQILAWIVHAKRPLSTLELQHALAVKPQAIVFEEAYIPSVEILRSVCMGLVTVDGESGTIRLVHYTTQEYFERTWKECFPDAQSYITTICVTYLSFASFVGEICQTNEEFKNRLQLNPLYDYAARNWGHHAREALNIPHGLMDFLGCLEKVEASIQAFTNLDSLLKPGQPNVSRRMTRFHLVAYFGVHRAMCTLLDRYHVDLTDKDHRTPLSWAAEAGHEAAVKLLIEKGADLEIIADNGRTPLSFAVDQGHVTVVKLLLEKGANVRTKASSSKELRFASKSQPPLSIAAARGYLALVELLLKNGADIEGRAYGEGTPLWLATRFGHETVVKLLLEKGAELESKDKGGLTPLSLAARLEYLGIVEVLLEKGANIEARDNCGRTPLCLAASSWCPDAVKLLLAREVDLEAKDEHGRTALSFAAGNSHPNIVQLLIERGAYLEAKVNENDWTPLFYAAKRENTTMVKVLLEAGAGLESRDNRGHTPLSFAADYGCSKIIPLLLDRGANIESKDDQHGRTPLSYAAGRGDPAVVKALLEAGVVLEARDNFGRTPLSHAAGNGRAAVVEILLKTGADPEDKDNYGWMPLSWASQKLQLSERDASFHSRKMDHGSFNQGNANTALREYQKQLMFLEQQKIKRQQTAAMATIKLLQGQHCGRTHQLASTV